MEGTYPTTQTRPGCSNESVTANPRAVHTGRGSASDVIPGAGSGLHCPSRPPACRQSRGKGDGMG